MRKASTSRTATGPTPGESGFQRSEGVDRNDGAVSRPGRWCLGDRHGGCVVSPEDPGPTPANGAALHRSRTGRSDTGRPRTSESQPGPAVPARPAPGRVRRTRHPPRPSSSPHPARHAIPWRRARRSRMCSGLQTAQNLYGNGVSPQTATDGTHGWVRKASKMCHS